MPVKPLWNKAFVLYIGEGMQQRFQNIFYFFPFQLFLLHFRKYQVLLLFWLVLFGTVNSSFLRTFGADSLFLSPEYLGSVNIFGTAIIGIAFGVFVMSWNVTTFILHTKRFKFLATNAQPFLKYCINNFLIPLLFLIFYFFKVYQFNDYRELMSAGKIISLISGIIIGFILLAAVSFAYFFSADRNIAKKMAPIISSPDLFRKEFMEKQKATDRFGMHVSYYLSTGLRLRKVRHVEHYTQQFIDAVFKRHHMATILSIGLAFLFLVAVGFFLETGLFDIPAAASFLIFLAILIAFMGAVTYFLQSWSLVFVVVLLFGLNILYKYDLLDPRNKAYGLNYSNSKDTSPYTKEVLKGMAHPDSIAADKEIMIRVLENWKKKQGEEKPLMVFINVSGGGLRSAAFVMNALQQIDSSTGGKLMQRTFLISGASGGMLAATYFREIYRKNMNDPSFPLYSREYTDNIAKDLLNPIFSSMVSRDLFAPTQRFKVGEYSYVKDRGYAFEQKLSLNTNGLINRQLKELSSDEHQAKVPLIFFNSVNKSDGRKLVISTLPVSYMMKPASQVSDTSFIPDAIDFAKLFAKCDPYSLRILTALRMNATFPYVLPTVWLPSEPVIDVMDAGLRDNYGLETTLRFIDHFEKWIRENTRGVLIFQIRDRADDNWSDEKLKGSVYDMLVAPATMLQYNWYKLQDYFQTDHFSLFQAENDTTIRRLTIMYKPEKEEKAARLNFHLTTREKLDVINALGSQVNEAPMKKVIELIGN